MDEHAWMRSFPAAITICDGDGIIIYMNDRAVKLFEKNGGAALIGSNVLDCHPGRAYARVRDLLESGGTDVFTVESNGVKRIVYDAPWYLEGRYCGLVEISFELPGDMKNFVRDDANRPLV